MLFLVRCVSMRSHTYMYTEREEGKGEEGEEGEREEEGGRKEGGEEEEEEGAV